MGEELQQKDQTVGAVLVVGGGIGGIQAALDLAESGYYVYLLERSPAIGGVMAQLDKTFPTLDCSMCILSPKLVATGRHPNIEIITQGEVEALEGEPGNFRVLVRKSPRYIIEDLCTGCGECAEVCPVERPNPYEEGLANRKAIYCPYPQAIPNIFTITKNEPPPCTTTCPINTNAQGYIALIGQGKFKEALDLIREKNPLPATCGRVCTHPCEGECNRREVDEPLAIRALKRFAADYEAQLGEEGVTPFERTREERVAIVGSGPAGLTCAHDLAQMGYGVTVFEALPVAGGMLAVGIPEYRLPKQVLRKEIERIQRLGVEFRLNTRIGTDLTLDELWREGYKAVFLATGVHRSMRLNVPGEDLEGVYHGVDFLRDLNLGREVRVGLRVVVIGGGNVAIDSARTALRLGAEEVTILYRRSRQEMPASAEEVEAAEEEGVKIHFLAAPVRILGEGGKAVGLECIRMELGEPDASGRRRPIPIEGSEFTLEADLVIPAIGQVPDLSSLAQGLQVDRRGLLEVDPVSLAAGLPGVFAGGDVVSGPATVIEAMAAGRRASTSIDRYLRGLDLKARREGEFLTTIHVPLDIDLSQVEKRPRQRVPTLPVEERIRNFREVELGFTQEMAMAEAQRCLNCGICSECFECVRTCKAEAIDHSQQPQLIELNVGAVILAPGFDEFAAQLKGEYGYGRYPNVVTSIQFERILSASGPFQGHVQRPSDGRESRKVAFIQCVGSRDVGVGNPYCSSVCCTYAVKEAIIAREHLSQVEPVIFCMDMRTYGKGFEAFYNRAREEYGVRFVRSRVSGVEETEDHNLRIRYETEGGELVKEEFDLVVLSVGLVPSDGVRGLAQKLGVELDGYGFCRTDGFSPLATSRPGVYVCGAFQGPKDIPETVMQASGAVACAVGLLSEARGTRIEEKVYPEEIDVSGQEPRIGVFICHCGINIGGYVRVPEVVEYTRTLPHVVYAEDNLYTCSQDTQERIKEKIKEYGLNRVVVASCTPRTHEPLFQETIREAGLNPYLFEMANIRDQCSWVHMHEPDRATQKAKDLVRAAVAKVGLLEPLREVALGVEKRCLVIGGGLSGMTAALSLAEQGFGVYLVEKERELGGNLRRLYYTLERDDVQEFLGDLIQKVGEHPNIEVITNAYIDDITGYVGNFTTGVLIAPSLYRRELRHGAVIVATGGEEYKPTEYLYGQDQRVLTQRELEERIAAGDGKLSRCRNIVMIQCVGSRDEERPYCSRICCSMAIKNVLKLKELNPQANVFILYRDMRTYGLKEEHYTRARAEGVIFVRYDPEDKPQVNNEAGVLRVSVFDPILRERLVIDTDLLVLSVGIIPYKNEELVTMLKVPVADDGFFLEAHVKLRPVDFYSDGIFLCGLAHSPKDMEESIAQAYAAAGRAATVLSKDQIKVGGVVAVVNSERCAACLTCVRVCPYQVPYINPDGVAEIEVAKCQGCGICAAECPAKAIQLQSYRDEQIMVACKALLKEA